MSIQRFHVGPRMSDMAVHNGTVYLAGQVADDTAQDISGQTTQVLATIDKLLAEAGTDKTKILSTTIYITDMANFPAMNAVWDAWVVAGNTPPRATVEAKLGPYTRAPSSAWSRTNVLRSAPVPRRNEGRAGSGRAGSRAGAKAGAFWRDRSRTESASSRRRGSACASRSWARYPASRRSASR